MLVVISPAKKLDENPKNLNLPVTNVQLPHKSQEVMQRLQKLKRSEITKLMKLSESLTELNFKRYQNFEKPTFKKAAIFLFAGDTYTGLQANGMSKEVITNAQLRLRILSGLYGVLRPLDEIVPYRLEMGVAIDIQKSKNLYDWWTDEVTNLVNKDLEKHHYLVNLASIEYFKVINTKKLAKPVINFKFLDKKNGEYKLISFNAKRARGEMAKIILEKSINDPQDLTTITFNGYSYNKELSSELNLTFTRDQL